MTPRQLIAVLGAVLLMVGAFAPLISVPVVGSISYFANGKGDGVFVAGLGAVALLAALAGKYRILPVGGISALLLLGITYYRLQSGLSRARAAMEAELAGNPFRGLADGMMQAVQIQWGFGVILIGALMLIAAGVMKTAPVPAREART